ncbi:MAG TPA: septal ring lytic transglycosylase RlpA family protein [Solirubrobacteraceae bacterium]|nr:septal ring lytic transglycosylase RlpA family protein [Solirubrobacteraceae bacterium]
MLLAGTPAVAQTPAPEAATPARGASKLVVGVKRLNVRAGGTAVVRGTLLPRQSHRIVRLELLQRGRWRQVDGDLTARSGRFVLRHRTRAADTSLVRVRFGGDPTARPSTRVVGRLNAFRPALASWYGPGLYGNALGCGGRLSPGTVGVAHKSLPCGTTVVLRKGSRTVRARVIDRGPYVGAREFDLTAATKYRLGFGSVGRVWVAH